MPVVGRLRAGASLAEGHAEVRVSKSRIGDTLSVAHAR